MFLLGYIFLVLGTVITCIFAHEEPYNEIVHRENPFVQIFRTIRVVPKEVLQISICFGIAFAGMFTFSTQLVVFFKKEVFPVGKSEEGKCFGMLTYCAIYFVSFVYSFFQPKLVEKVSTKHVFVMSQIIGTISLLFFFFVINEWGLLFICSLYGINLAVLNSIPYAILVSVVPKETIGLYMGIMTAFSVIGSQIGSIFCTMIVPLIEKAITGNQHLSYQIGSGFVFSIIAAIVTALILKPTKNESLYQPVIDE